MLSILKNVCANIYEAVYDHAFARLPLITCVSVSFTIWYIGRKIYLYRQLPPGPRGLPFLGCLHKMNTGAPHSWYVQLAAKYGDLLSLRLGPTLVVCISSARLLRDLFNRNDSTGRPHTPLNNLMEGLGIITSEGQLWKKQRQFIKEKIRAMGVKLLSNQRFEQFILLEVEDLMANLRNRLGQPIDPADDVGRHLHNVICQLMMSFRFEQNNQIFVNFNEKLKESFRVYGLIHYGEHVPYYFKIPGNRNVLQQVKQNLEDVREFHNSHINARRERRRRLAINYQEPVDLLDFYLNEIDDKGSSDLFPNGTNPDKQLVQVMNDLFSAGMETSRTTVLWLLVMMVREPEVAVKVREALAEVIAPRQTVTLDLRPRLVYVEAVIFETLRRAYVVPLGTTHVNTTTWQVNGYLIPAGSHLIPLLNKINMDPQEFPEPERFIPERFIRDGSLRIPDTFLPFGVGRRVCLGEQLARMELFLFFANIMNNFTFSLPAGEKTPSLEGILGTTHAPMPYSLNFRLRDE